MADVFISYSRKDIDFVRHLLEALAARNRKAWVDWNDIPPSADFMEEIYAAIEKANTFVYVLSPDSIASAVCSREVAHAIKNHKRLLPVVTRDVSADQVT